MSDSVTQAANKFSDANPHSDGGMNAHIIALIIQKAFIGGSLWQLEQTAKSMKKIFANPATQKPGKEGK